MIFVTQTAALYIRQSQTSDGTISPELQEKNVRAFIASQGWEAGEVYSDIDISGLTEAKRPAFLKLKEDYIAGKFQVAVADDFSRFSRNKAQAMALLGAMNIATAKEGVADTSDDFMPAMYFLLADKFSKDMSKRWSNALTLRFEKGVPPSGKRQFGYDKVDGRYEQNPEQAAILREAYERYVAGEGARVICDDFNKRGLPSAGPAGWYPNGLFDLLDKPFYGGDIVWTKYKKVFVDGEEKRVVDEVLTSKGAHVPILDPAEWAAYLKAREARKTYKKPRNPKWFASGIVRCGLCEAPMVSARDTRGVDNLVCSVYNNKGKAACPGIRRKRAIVSFKIHMWLNTHYDEWTAGMPTDDEAKLAAEKALADAEEALKAAQRDYNEFMEYAYQHKLLPSATKPALDTRANLIAEREAQRDNALAATASFQHSDSPSDRITKGLLLMGFTEGEDDEPSPEATARFREALSGVIEKVLVMPQSTSSARDPKREFYKEIVIVPRKPSKPTHL